MVLTGQGPHPHLVYMCIGTYLHHATDLQIRFTRFTTGCGERINWTRMGVIWTDKFYCVLHLDATQHPSLLGNDLELQVQVLTSMGSVGDGQFSVTADAC